MMAGDNSDYHEMIDACRSTDDAERVPELRPLAEGLKQDPHLREELAAALDMDLRIKQGLQRVAVPEGLASRILGSLRDESHAADPLSASSEAAGIETAAEHASRDEVVVLRSGERPARRRALRVAIAAVIAIAATILIAVSWFPRGSGKLTEREMRNALVAWVAAAANTEWQSAEFPLQRFPLSRSLRLRTPRRWFPIKSTGTPDQAVCYELNLPGEPVLLFVVRTDREIELPVVAPAQPLSNTQNLCLAAWQERGVVFGLAVQGDTRRWQSLPWAGTSIASVY
jgi:hypothetical protein